MDNKDHESHTPAKRTQREIRRMAAATRLILESAKKLGPGSDRHVSFMGTLQRLREYKTLPSWRRAYVQGYAEGASAILALLAAGAINLPEAVIVEAKAPAERPAARARVMKQLPDVGSVPPPAAVEAPAAPKPTVGAPEDAYVLLQRLQAALAAISASSPAPDAQ